MKQDEIFVITINRELGSGGRTVGEKLAKNMDGLSLFPGGCVYKLLAYQI